MLCKTKTTWLFFTKGNIILCHRYKVNHSLLKNPFLWVICVSSWFFYSARAPCKHILRCKSSIILKGWLEWSPNWLLIDLWLLVEARLRWPCFETILPSLFTWAFFMLYSLSLCLEKEFNVIFYFNSTELCISLLWNAWKSEHAKVRADDWLNWPY